MLSDRVPLGEVVPLTDAVVCGVAVPHALADTETDALGLGLPEVHDDADGDPVMDVD